LIELASLNIVQYIEILEHRKENEFEDALVDVKTVSKNCCHRLVEWDPVFFVKRKT